MDKLIPGSAITRWRHGPPDEQYFPGIARAMDDRVTYRFVNGWVDTGELPCREALRRLLPSRRPDRPAGPFPMIYIGNPDSPVDFSRFCHRPTLIRRAFQTVITAETSGLARFRLETAGGVRIWLGDDEVAVFEPFQRNVPNASEFSVRLDKGPSEMTLLLEDLHERDTMCFFSLRWLDGPSATIEVGLDDHEAVDRVSKSLASLRTERAFVTQGAVRLVADPPPAGPVTFNVRGIAPFPRGGLVIEPGAGLKRRITLTPDRPEADVFRVGDTHAGCISMDVSAETGGVTLNRRLGITVLPPGIELSGTLAKRKSRAADEMAAHGGFDPSVATLLAMRGQAPGRVAGILTAVLPTIEDRHDCADFSILSLLRLWRDARGALAADMAARLKRAILGFRYWMTEPGNDVMWFWSENHVLCFHTAQAIAGGLFPDEIFASSGKAGRELRSDALVRLSRWFDSIETHGLCEWNSAAYYPIDLLALFSLHDLEPDLTHRAAGTLDRLFEMVALHTSGGVPAGAQGRCYEKELLAGPATELGSVAAIAFGGRYWTGCDRAAALFCMSDYAPPEQTARYARPGRSAIFRARYTQGLNHAGKLTLWKTGDGQLSCATGHDTSLEGHQAHVVDVQMSAHPMARLWINHPGDLAPWGERRPSLLAGNHVMPAVAQSGSLALLLYDLDRDWTAIHATQLFAFTGAFDRIETVDDWRLFQAGSGCVAVWSSCPLSGVDGLYRGMLWRARALVTGWVVAMSLPGETRADFVKRLEAATPGLNKTGLICRDPDGRQLGLGLDGQFTIDEDRVRFSPLPVRPEIVRDSD